MLFGRVEAARIEAGFDQLDAPLMIGQLMIVDLAKPAELRFDFGEAFLERSPLRGRAGRDLPPGLFDPRAVVLDLAAHIVNRLLDRSHDGGDPRDDGEQHEDEREGSCAVAVRQCGVLFCHLCGSLFCCLYFRLWASGPPWVMVRSSSHEIFSLCTP